MKKRNTQNKRKNMISFSEAECNMDERFISKLNSEIMLGKKIDTLVYKSDTDVFVKR